MLRAAPPAGRRLLMTVAALLLILHSASGVSADQPGPTPSPWGETPSAVKWLHDRPAGTRLGGLARRELVQAQSQAAPRCENMRFSDVSAQDVRLTYTDADLVAESDGSRLCLFFDARWDSYNAFLINQRSLDDFRDTKAQLQPLLHEIGLDPCDIAFWDTLDRSIRRQLTLRDLYDAGTTCAPEFFEHGPRSRERAAEVAEATALSARIAETAFDWRLSFPIRVHVYDSHNDFVAGVRREGGDDRVTSRDLEGVGGLTGDLANGQLGYLINIDRFAEPVDLRMLVAHEFAHIAQAGLLGDPDYLPFFVIEGGAEYFASLVVGTEQRNLAGRFREAVADERAGRALPLRDLIAEPDEDDSTASQASYSRGYAAMRFLAARWGPEAFTRLHQENIDGSPDRFLDGMAHLTGLSLNEFDRELGAWLPTQVQSAATVGNSTLAPDSMLADLVTAAPLGGGGAIDQERFTRTDSVVLVLLTWECLPRAIRGEARFIAPDGRLFTRLGGMSGPGCDVENYVEFVLDRGVGGRIPRGIPGTWRVEVYADDVLQGSVTFVLE